MQQEGAATPPLPPIPRSKMAGKQATVPLSTLLDWGTTTLHAQGLPAIEARWLLEWSIGVDSLIRADQNVGIRAAETYRSAISQRRTRVPLQHITGEMSFRTLTLAAGPGVYSVRPETETLVDLGLECLRRQLSGGQQGDDDSKPAPSDNPDTSDTSDHREEGSGRQLRVVDMCAGSGAIGLSVSKEHPSTHTKLIELDGKAVRYLRANAMKCAPYAPNSSVEVVVGDATRALPSEEGTIDLVLSNPPYVGITDAPTQPEALQDPPVALYGGGEDGLVTPRGVVGRAYKLLRPGGDLVMEHGEEQGKWLRDHALAVGFDTVSTQPDLTGRSRFLVAHKNAAQENDGSREASEDRGQVNRGQVKRGQ